jgi:hypothetical protein
MLPRRTQRLPRYCGPRTDPEYPATEKQHSAMFNHGTWKALKLKRTCNGGGAEAITI